MPPKSVAELLATCVLQARHVPETDIPLEEPCWVPRNVTALLLEACCQDFWRLVGALKVYNRRHPEQALYAFRNGGRVGVCTERGFRGFYANWTEGMFQRFVSWFNGDHRSRCRQQLPEDLSRRLPVI